MSDTSSPLAIVRIMDAAGTKRSFEVPAIPLASADYVRAVNSHARAGTICADDAQTYRDACDRDSHLALEGARAEMSARRTALTAATVPALERAAHLKALLKLRARRTF